MDALVTIANGFFILGYFVKDLLKLRALSFAGASCLAIYFGFRPEPLPHVAGWNVLFAALNALWICRLAYEKTLHARRRRPR